MTRSPAILALAALLATGQLQAQVTISPPLEEAASQGATPEWTGDRGTTPGSGVPGPATPGDAGSTATPSDR